MNAQHTERECVWKSGRVGISYSVHEEHTFCEIESEK